MASYARRTYLSDEARSKTAAETSSLLFVQIGDRALWSQPRFFIKEKIAPANKPPLPILDLTLTYPWV
jgi:hypothetical protein